MLQESVDALFDNGRRGRVITGANSAAEVAERHAEGQAGPLPPETARQARRLLGPLGGSWSARAQLLQCGPPEEDGGSSSLSRSSTRAYRPTGMANTIKAASAWSRGAAEVWDILEEVIREHPVLLNRAADPASSRHPGLRAGADRG